MNWCTFKLSVLGDTPQDPDFREAESYRKYSARTVKGQLVGARDFNGTQRTATGDALPSRGTAVFRYNELRAAGYQNGTGPKKGDLIVEMFVDGPNPRCPSKGRTKYETQFRIIQAAPFSPLRRQFLMWKIEFEQDRKVRESV